jgi:isopropylmalate/homocitrate/citramalate synthase
MSRNLYKHLAGLHKDTVRHLTDTYGLGGIRSFPEKYRQCVESQVSYHSYMRLHYEQQMKRTSKVNMQEVTRRFHRHTKEHEKALARLDSIR